MVFLVHLVLKLVVEGFAPLQDGLSAVAGNPKVFESGVIGLSVYALGLQDNPVAVENKRFYGRSYGHGWTPPLMTTGLLGPWAVVDICVRREGRAVDGCADQNH